jgi:hypothetical protein
LTWKKLPISNRNEFIASFTQKLMVDKATQLHLSEQKSASISKELYWKYHKENKQKNFAFTCTWSEWLKNRHNRLDNDLEKFQKNIHEREAAATATATRKRTVAPLIEIESKIHEVADTFARKGLSYYSIELRKSLVALRKTASEAGYGNGLVSKEIFDRHMTHVLAPRVADLPKDLKVLAVEARNCLDRYTLTHSLTHPYTYSLIHSLVQSIEQSVIDVHQQALHFQSN